MQLPYDRDRQKGEQKVCGYVDYVIELEVVYEYRGKKVNMS